MIRNSRNLATQPIVKRSQTWPHAVSLRILIQIPSQALELYQGRVLLHRDLISTGANGTGERIGSGCTPRRRHRVRIGIGGGCPEGTVFSGRRPTGEIDDSTLAARFPDRDLIELFDLVSAGTPVDIVDA